jgi:phenylacetate-CoA ligase
MAMCFKQNGITPESFRSIADIRKLPFKPSKTCATISIRISYTPEKRNHPVTQLERDNRKPNRNFHNRHDINSWANLMARSLYCAGIRDTDVFQNICGYGLFTGGLGFQYGIERLGCLSIPAGAGNSQRQIKLMLDYGTTAAHAIPSYLTRLYEVFPGRRPRPQKDTQ